MSKDMDYIKFTNEDAFILAEMQNPLPWPVNRF